MKKLYSNKLYIALFIAPALILFLGVLVVPIFQTFYYSLYDSKLLVDGDFVGFENYKTLFDPTISKSIIPALKNSLILAGLSVFIQLPLSLFLALIIAKGRKGERVFLSIYFIPVVISTVIVAQLWAMIYKPTDGLLDFILRSLGSDAKIPWLTGDYALAAVLIPTLWQYVGYHMLLMYAGIKGVPTEYREAAMIDGAKEWQVNRYIVLPYIKPILKICVIFAVTGSLKSYDLIKILSGDNNSKTKVLSTEMIKWLILSDKKGLGSAIAVIMIVLCFAFALIIGRIFRDKED